MCYTKVNIQSTFPPSNDSALVEFTKAWYWGNAPLVSVDVSRKKKRGFFSFLLMAVPWY